MIYCDIKLVNVMFDCVNGGLKLMDFGIVCVGDGSCMCIGFVFGMLFFMLFE